MKSLKLLLLLFTMSATVVYTTSCDKDDDDEATCFDGIQNGNETGVDCGGDCAAACPTCSDGIQNGDETGVDCGGSCDPCPTCSDGIQNGDETGVDCGGSCDPCVVGLEGEWQSSGANVAPLLVTLFDTDSIYANFRSNMTYEVHQFDSQGAMITLIGTYTQSMSSVAGIWNITVNQSSPAALTSEGIFQITDNTMKYEIVQTEPAIGATPPTAAAGFGSTNGGTLGTANVQNYIRIE